MSPALQCQQEAARFASTPATVDELRRKGIRAALASLRAGDRAAALEAMFDTLSAQAPLSFTRPAVTR